MGLLVKLAMTSLFWHLYCCGLIYLFTRNDETQGAVYSAPYKQWFRIANQ